MKKQAKGRGRVMSRLFVMVATMVAGALAFADPFVYVDHWPSGSGDETATEVLIPDGTTAPIATAEDVARVARLTSISLGGGDATVAYTASDALSLSASVSGTGRFSAVSAGDLTLSGDNSDLVSPGCFFFSNMAVTVSSRYGLGSTGSATLHYWIGGKVDPLEFTGAGLTNDAPMQVHQGTANYNFVLGPKNADETLVIRNTITFDQAANSSDYKKMVFFRNKVKFRAGTFYNKSALLYSSALTSGSAEVWFEESATVKFSYWFTYGNMTVHLNSGVLSGSLIAMGHDNATPRAVLEANGILNTLGTGASGNGTFDLNGHDQSLKLFSKTYGGKIRFASATPATLTMSSYNSSADNKGSSAKFTGDVNFKYNPGSATAEYTLTGSSALSDAHGTLTVSSGKLVFSNGAGWGGTNVVVKSGAALDFASDKSMTNVNASLVIEEGGRLTIRSGGVCKAKSVVFGDNPPLAAGREYTVADLVEMGFGDYVDGDDDGYIDLSAGLVWNGWPTTPGAVADVPENTTVYASDDDVANIEALGGIRLRSGSVVVCTNLTQELDLSAPVYGVGTFKVIDSENVVMRGDNSGLLSPGCFFFSNTTVTVASRYGLGSTGSAPLHYWFGDKVAPLNFVGNGLTNDAPLRVHQGTQDYNFVIGPTNANDTLVIAGDLYFNAAVNSSDYKRILYFRNNVKFIGGTVGPETSSHLYCEPVAAGAEVWFESPAKVKFSYWFADGGRSSGILKLHCDWSGLAGTHGLICFGNNAPARLYAICDSDNLLGTLGDGISGRDGGTLDLNGHDQWVKYFNKVYEFGEGGVNVTSETPATLSVSNYNSGVNYMQSRARFSGNAGFAYCPNSDAAAFTLTDSKAYSTTSGPLTVGRGTLSFAGGAGWCGTNVTIRSGATLSVGEASMPAMFGSKAVLGHQSRTKLVIESGGTLELAASTTPAVVRSFVYNGLQMPAGTYTSSSGVGITGGGSLRVRSSTDGEPGFMMIFY